MLRGRDGEEGVSGCEECVLNREVKEDVLETCSLSRYLQTSGRKGIWQKEQSRKELRKSE